MTLYKFDINTLLWMISIILWISERVDVITVNNTPYYIEFNHVVTHRA